ncbi:MAG TPA: amidohydrolase family protein [Gaiellaceae bacterium]|nr:amidohydrolase family protein [Gaiellaceae bacterium]
MDEPLSRAQELLASYDDELRRLLPDDAEIFDAHLHLGQDIDGTSGQYEELERIMDKYGISHAFMFCMDEPDREPAFRAPNGRTLEFARRSGGRLIPFVRLDLTAAGPIDEAIRCFDLGARGIKLHPRAQRFTLNDERLAPVFELAAERRVPILIHGGRGLPPIADHLRRLVETYPEAQLIIAHAGIADMAALAGCFAGKKGVFFDTSVWSPVDLLDFFHHVPPEQILYASDYPYGRQPQSLTIALRTAITAGLDERQLRDMLAGNANRIANGDEPLEPSTPSGTDEFTQSMALARVHQYLSMATPLLWTRQQDTIGVIGLALNACYERNGYPGELDQIKELLTTAQELWRSLPDVEDEGDEIATRRATFAMVHLADIIAVTPGA